MLGFKDIIKQESKNDNYLKVLFKVVNIMLCRDIVALGIVLFLVYLILGYLLICLILFSGITYLLYLTRFARCLKKSDIQYINNVLSKYTEIVTIKVRLTDSKDIFRVSDRYRTRIRLNEVPTMGVVVLERRYRIKKRYRTLGYSYKQRR